MRWKTGLGHRLSIANLPTNMLCGLVLLAGEFGVNAESWFAGMRLNVQEIHDPQARVSYRQASEIIRRALPTLPIDGVGLAMGEKQNGGNFGLLLGGGDVLADEGGGPHGPCQHRQCNCSRLIQNT